MLWTNKELESLELNMTVYNNIEMPDGKKDWVSFAVLRKYGGLVLDIDTICLKPFDELIHKYSMLFSMEPASIGFKIPNLNFGLLASGKDNQIWAKLQE